VANDERHSGQEPRYAAFPALKPSTATVSLRLPASMLDELKALANERDVPYQALLKVFLADVCSLFL
jgi:predicted DNA binding CopG/RHH family protein